MLSENLISTFVFNRDSKTPSVPVAKRKTVARRQTQSLCILLCLSTAAWIDFACPSFIGVWAVRALFRLGFWVSVLVLFNFIIFCIRFLCFVRANWKQCLVSPYNRCLNLYTVGYINRNWICWISNSFSISKQQNYNFKEYFLFSLCEKWSPRLIKKAKTEPFFFFSRTLLLIIWLFHKAF